jgi:hypothetical protein
MQRAHTIILLSLVGSLSGSAQTLSLAEVRGSWYFHQYFVDSALFADADKPTPFPKRDYDMLKQQAAWTRFPSPDSAAFAQQLRQNDENYRRYRLEFKEDSTYATELASGMSKWLPENGRLRYADTDGLLQMLDSFGTAVTSAIAITSGELHLSLADPMLFDSGFPTMKRELVFRRKEP